MAAPKLSDHSGDEWGEMAKIYHKLTVGVAEKPTVEILRHLDDRWPFSKATAIHDNGCGPGPIISHIIQDYGDKLPAHCELSCSDFSAPMIDRVKHVKREETAANPNSLWSRVDAQVLDAMDLKGIPDNSKSHVTAGWVYFMTPDPQKCLSESLRVLRKDGVLGCSSWKDSQWLQLMRMVGQVRPDKQLPGIPAEWQTAGPLKGELEKAGFREVESFEVEVIMTFESYDATIDLLTTKMPHMIAMLKDFSENEMQQLSDKMLRQMKEWCPELPGKLYGTALVAVGRKWYFQS
ncbi:COQ5 family methyltransferase like [Lecanosticta acicola]|uniref:COQ5 family methyltransferase like n=1 Tax=Lecanosticta acicola TaxID=111012 RepID=A0AAI8YY22_9PEZI|nr:COQ5 family methyltransferase like [Lecanosticta acicola]